MTTAMAAPAFAPSHSRALGWMAAAGIAIGVAPSALWAVVGHVMRAQLEFSAYPPLSKITAALFAAILAACAFAIAGGLAHAVLLARTVGPIRPIVVRWLLLAVPALAALVFPPFWFLGTVWLFISATLAVRALSWRLAARGAASSDHPSQRVRYRRWAAGITLIAHVLAWGAVLAAAFPVSTEEFARIEAERRARVNAPAGVDAGGIDFIEMDGGGAIAAGRYVGGDMSAVEVSIGPWPAIAEWLVVPDGNPAPTERESWLVAALAFVASTLFWTPWVVMWTGRVCRGARPLGART